MNDISTEGNQPIQEKRDPAAYIHMINEGDPADEIYEDEQGTSIEFPKRKIGRFGTMQMYAFRPKTRPNGTALYLSNSGVSTIDKGEGFDLGHYGFWITVQMPPVLRKQQFLMDLSLDGKKAIVRGNFKDDPIIPNALTTIWESSEDKKQTSSILYVPYSPRNRKFLEDLYFRFSMVDPIQKGNA